MAYVNKGSSNVTDTTYWKDSGIKTIDNNVTNINIDEDYACCFVFKEYYDSQKWYEFRCFQKNTSTYKYEFKGHTTTNRTYTHIAKDGTTTVNTYTSENTIALPRIGFNDFEKYTSDYIYSTNLPVFDDEASFQRYFQSGDVSGQVVLYNTDWNLFIDGAQNPLYKLTWNCEGINDLDVSNSFIKIWVGTFFPQVGHMENVVEFKTVNYSQGKTKFSYADLMKVVDQPLIGTYYPTIMVQLGYREFVTAKIETSTKMGCTLYYDKSIARGLYNVLGYMTLNEDSQWTTTSSGDGSTFTVKDGQEGSDGYTSDDDGGYDDGKDNDDADGESSDISAGIGVLTTTFKMTKERLQQLGQFLWGSSIFDKFSLVNNNPIENIVSCKAIPLEQSGSNQEIVLGNVETGVNGEKISNNFGKQTIGSIAISEYYKNFLDYSPYTNVIIYLPYIGFRELDTSMVMGKTLKVEYTTDCITGGCLAQISVGGVRLYEFTGNMGIDIPITASNRAQVEAGYIQAGVGAAMSLAGGNIVGATTALINSATAQYHYSSTGNPSPMCVASTNRTCYVVIDRPQYQKLNAFNHTRGQKCNLSKTIGSLKGFTICDSHIDLSGISATETEKEEIVNILSTGFFA